MSVSPGLTLFLSHLWKLRSVIISSFLRVMCHNVTFSHSAADRAPEKSLSYTTDEGREGEHDQQGVWHVEATRAMVGLTGKLLLEKPVDGTRIEPLLVSVLCDWKQDGQSVRCRSTNMPSQSLTSFRHCRKEASAKAPCVHVSREVKPV